MNVKRINQLYAVSDKPIYINKNASAIVEQTSEDAHSLLVWSGQPFPITTAIRLGLLTEDTPIALEPLEETKAITEPDENKMVSVGSTKNRK